MAQFEVPVVRVDRIEEHPGADALEIAVVRGYRCVTKIGAHRAGDLVAYIPEDAIVPETLIRELRLWDEAKGRGMLAGKKGDRVKAIRLRGVVSQGLLYPVEGREEGENLAEALDIVRYEPPIPVYMQGEVSNVRGHTLPYDIESIQKFPRPAARRRGGGLHRETPRHLDLLRLLARARPPGSPRGSDRHRLEGHERRRDRLQVERGQPQQPLRDELHRRHARRRAVGPGAVRRRARRGADLHPRRDLREEGAGPRLRPAGTRVPGVRRVRRPAAAGAVSRLRRTARAGQGRVGARHHAAALPGAVLDGGRGAAPGREDHVPGRPRPRGHRDLAGEGAGVSRTAGQPGEAEVRVAEVPAAPGKT